MKILKIIISWFFITFWLISLLVLFSEYSFTILCFVVFSLGIGIKLNENICKRIGGLYNKLFQKKNIEYVTSDISSDVIKGATPISIELPENIESAADIKQIKDENLQTNKKTCKFCITEIHGKAIVCPNCKKDLRNFTSRHPILTFCVFLLISTSILNHASEILYVQKNDIIKNQQFNTLNNKKENNSNTSLIVDIKKISNKNSKEVEKELWKPYKTEIVKPSSTWCNDAVCNKMYYQNWKYEIVFINWVSDWITINNVSNVSFNEDMISLLWLSQIQPTITNSFNMRWENIDWFKEIYFFNNRDYVDYIYVKVNSL